METYQEVEELTIPDVVIPCWVFTDQPWFCPDSIASWRIITKDGWVGVLCNGCKNRWEHYGTVLISERIGNGNLS